MQFLVTPSGPAGSRTPVRAWQVASTEDVGDDGGRVSHPGYDGSRWLVAPPRSTVMAALLANGQHKDVLFSTTMRDTVDPARFAVPWWFRSQFTVSGEGRTHVRVDGVIPKADLWVNGTRVVGADDLAGAYVTTSVDVTGLVRPGVNVLALLVHPGNPMEDLSIGWVDWSQLPPDNNMGPWRDVAIVRTGGIRLGAPHAATEPEPGGPDGPARLRVTVDAHNDGDAERTVELACAVEGHGTSVIVHRQLVVPARTTVTVRFGDGGAGEGQPADDQPQGHRAGGDGQPGEGSDWVTVRDPVRWWPIGYGEQPLYRLSVTASAGGVLTDHVETRFGIRTVDTTMCPGGGRRFFVNGRAVQILGAGWSPDLFLRHDDRRISDQLALTAHMGLNTIRPEGKLENPEFYDLCDQMGIMVLPGWECCNKWEAAAGTGGAMWDEHDKEVSARSMASEAELLRSHPSVIGFLVGSDFAPPGDVAARYAAALESKGWDLPVIASATVQGSDVTGPSGMKMTGPYDWVPPVYWYQRDQELGGAVGFNSETSAGHTVPRLASLRRMLSPHELDQLWQHPELRQYHSGPPSVFDNLTIFARALSERYGPPKSAEDFVNKAQLAAYEAARAQFEAFTLRENEAEPATGVVYWMLSAPWPSLNWQLFDYDLDTPGSYNGVRKALEPVHALYAYDTRSLHVLNRTGEPAAARSLAARRWRCDGTLIDESRHDVAPLEPWTQVQAGTVEAPGGVVGAWFLELELSGGGAAATRNVYWLSTDPDVLDPSTTTWHSTGVSCFADLKGLDWLRSARVRARAGATEVDGELEISLVLDHDDPSGTPAVGLHASLWAGRDPVAPVRWDDNDVTLFSRQSATLTGRLRLPGDPGGQPLSVRLEGFNLYRPLVMNLGR
jgi:exo-1,4-beta-D-glucosaminidase